MAKMTEADAFALIEAAARVAALVPTLLANWAAIKDGLAEDRADELNAKIVAAHADVQALDAQLAALGLGDAG